MKILTEDQYMPMENMSRDEMLKEGFQCLARAVEDRTERFPRPDDKAADFAKKRNILLNKIVPMSIVPLATSNAMLTMGSQKLTGPGGDCTFPLPQYLIWAGAISLSLVMLGVVSRHILDWVLEDKYVGGGEKNIIAVLEYMASFAASLQAAVLLSGTLILFPHLAVVNTRDRDDPNYCDRGLVLFSLVFLSMCWIFVLLGLVAYIYIKATGDDVASEVKARILRELLDEYRDSKTSAMTDQQAEDAHAYLKRMAQEELDEKMKRKIAREGMHKMTKEGEIRRVPPEPTDMPSYFQ